MRRAVAYAAAIALLLSGGATAATEALAEARPDVSTAVEQESARPTDWRSEHCRYASRDGHRGWSVDEVKATLRCAGRRFGGNVDLAFRIVACESGFHADAENSSSSAGGVWQSLDSTFETWYGGQSSIVHRWELRHHKLNGRTNAVLGYRVFTWGTGPWSASAWCWG